MAQNTAVNVEEIVEDFDDEDDEFTKDDFGFIIGPDGELKSIMYPEHLMEDPPEEIKMILQIFDFI